MINNRQQQLNQKDQETLNENKQIASILIQDVTYNIMINRKRSELTNNEYLKWLDQIKRLDQQKSVLIQEVDQYQNFLNKVDIKQTQTYEQLGFFGQMKQQLKLEIIQAQIKKKIQIEQEQIIGQLQIEIETQSNKIKVDKNQQILEEIQEETDQIINEEIKKNSKFDEQNEIEIENNLDKLKYQSKKASKGKLFNNVIKSFMPFQKKEL